MAGKRSSGIPLLKSVDYRRAYLKDAPVGDVARPLGPSTGHFGIDYRCIWNDMMPAHRLDFYMVFLVMAGEGVHRFGLEEYALEKNMLCFVGPDMVSSWEMTSGDQGGYVCTFSADFFHGGLADQRVLSRLSFFGLEGRPVIQLSEEQAAEYVDIFKLMEREYRKPAYAQAPEDGAEVLRGYLHALIGKARRDHSDAAAAQISTAVNRANIRLLDRFTEMFSRDFDAIRVGQSLAIRKISEYADLLGVSQNHLNDTIQALTGLSAGQHIRNRLIQQATMCLMHSDKTVSEIAYRLGYDDPSYFARFYKSQTGKTPSEIQHSKFQTPD